MSRRFSLGKRLLLAVIVAALFFLIKVEVSRHEQQISVPDTPQDETQAEFLYHEKYSAETEKPNISYFSGGASNIKIATNKTTSAPENIEQEKDQDYMAMLHSTNTGPPSVVNPHSFSRLLQPKSICSEGLDLLIYIHSAPDHYKRRTVIRSTWGNPANFKQIKLRLFFVVGFTPDNPSLQEALKFESESYGDILQENFVDSYTNLTLKAVCALKYISENCNDVSYILKTDDDIFVNIFSLVRSLYRPSQEKRELITCLVWHRMPVMRDPQSKWYVPESLWKDPFYPTYCSGSAYVMSGDVPARLFTQSLYTPFFWVDDLYITGILARELGLKHNSIHPAYELNFERFQSAYKENPEKATSLIFSHAHDLDKVQNLWKLIYVSERDVTARYLSNLN